MPNKKICVIGAGRWGQNHVRTLAKLGALSGIVDSDESRLKAFAAEFPDITCLSTVKDALSHDFDGYTVATPAHTHYEIARFLIENKKHVLVEKPMALTAQEARSLKALSEKHGVKLMVGHVMLFHPAICKIKELINSDKIGKLEYIYSNRLNLGAVRQEENALWSFAPHDISIFQHLIGDMPVHVVANGGAFLQPHIHDVTMTSLTYPKNIVGHIFVSWLHPFKEHRLVIIGSKGMLMYEDSSKEKNILYYEKSIDWLQGEPVKREGPTEKVPYERGMPLDIELQYFIDHLDGSEITVASPASAVEVLQILEQATQHLDVPTNVYRAPLAATGEEKKPFYVHETARIDAPAEIGDGTQIWHFSHIMKNVKIGKDCKFGQNTFVASDVQIGNNVKVQNNVSLYTGVQIEDDVFLGPSCVFTNVINPRAEINRQAMYQKTLLKRGVTVGANATIICGIEIGRFAFVAAGAVVTKDVPDYALMIGSPAKRVGWMSRHGVRLPEPGADGVMVCPESGLRYQEDPAGTLRCLDINEDEPIQSGDKS